MKKHICYCPLSNRESLIRVAGGRMVNQDIKFSPRKPRNTPFGEVNIKSYLHEGTELLTQPFVSGLKTSLIP